MGKRLIYEASRPVAIYGAYLIAFYIVSFWEIIPGTTVRFLKFNILYVLIIFEFFAVGYYLHQKAIVATFSVLGSLLVIFALSQLILTPDLTRFGYGSLGMLVFVVLVAYNKLLLAGVLFVVMAMSNNVIPVVASLVSIFVYFVALGKGNVFSVTRASKLFTFLVPLFAIFFIALIFFGGRIEDTVSRLLSVGLGLSGEDLTRAYIHERSQEMLMDSGGIGIGYMNFYAYSGWELDYLEEARTGSAIEGHNLHNSFMTWGLEGGILVVLVVFWLIISTVKRIRSIYLQDTRMGSCLFGFTAAFVVFAIAHQLHELISFWATIGFVWGYEYKLRTLHKKASQMQASQIEPTLFS
jgi:hypothetical protein